jgi:hypothetical protein
MLEYGKYYHIFNKGAKGISIFIKENDYIHFLDLMSIFLTPVADIYAYALMGNHLHLVLRIKDKTEIGYLDSEYADSDDINLKWKTYPVNTSNKTSDSFNKKPVPGNMLKHMFNSYAQWFNKSHNRSGQLLKHNYDKIIIDNVTYLKRLIIYVHNNPVKHGFCEHPVEYGWTSYLSLISIKPTKLSRERVLGWFDDKANFKIAHNNSNDDFGDIKDLFLE